MTLRRGPPFSPAPPAPEEASPLGSSLELSDDFDDFEATEGAEPCADPELPPGVEPWNGDEMPAGSASSHGLHASEHDAASAAPPASLAPDGSSEAPLEPLPEGDELNYRHLYETRFRPLELGLREEAARRASGSELFALCLDAAPQVVAALLENPQFGLGHARSLAQHHTTDRGLEILARRAQFLRDSHVQRRLLQNTQTPDVALDRVLRLKRLIDVYRLSIDRELPERSRVRVRSRLRPFFTRAEPEDRAALILKTEGRCLVNLSGCTFDARLTQILCTQTIASTLFIQNLARFSATPPALIAKLLRSPTVQRQPPLRMLLARHPNAGSDAKRRS